MSRIVWLQLNRRCAKTFQFMNGLKFISRFDSNSRQITTSNISVLKLPALSPTMTHGTISVWKKQPGDLLNAGEILCEVETDKASVGLDVQDEGVLAKILVQAQGSELAVGKPIALLVEDAQSYNEFLALESSQYQHLIDGDAVSAVKAPIESPELPTTSSQTIPKQLSPAARHLVNSKSVDISTLSSASGKNGRIVTKGDIILALKSGTIKPQSKPQVSIPTSIVSSVEPTKTISSTATTSLSAPLPVTFQTAPINSKYKDIPNSSIRKVIAKRLTESKATVPHIYVSTECEIDAILSLRKKLKNDFELNVSVNDLVIKSAALALRDVPEAYATWNKKTNSIEAGKSIDISVAVATPTGLITPIVKEAHKLGLTEVNSKVKDLATRARDGKLKPEEYQGGSFSISNLGMFGINSFSAVINPPQSCILAVGSGVTKVVPVYKDKSVVNIKSITSVTVQLSGDRRVVDETVASQFLQVFKSYLSDPNKLML